MVNSVTLIGRMGKDPEVRRLESGAVVAKIAIATTEKYKDSSGQQQEKTEWHNVVAWRGLAEIMEKYYKKGQLVYVEGKISTRKWQDANGADRWSTDVIANTSRIVSNPNGGGGGGNGGFPTEEPVRMSNNSAAPASPTAAPTTTPAAPVTPAAPAAEEGGDLPF